jgi:GT2 family glycosyltransferase
MQRFISIIIPNYNSSATIERCLTAALSSEYEQFEVIVVDDCSSDNSIELIKKYPCKLIQLHEHHGVSKARNIGARNSNGDILFFTDADCCLAPDALYLVNKTMHEKDICVVGGTYTRIPYDKDFFSIFQSIFISYFETKHKEPDYIATHAMAIDAKVFRELGGFVENSFIGVCASIEDVEFCHRLRRAGYKLYMNPDILVQHIFNFSLVSSLRNAAKKSMFWIMYSMSNRDLLADSGCASLELKLNGILWLLCMAFLLLYVCTGQIACLIPIPVLYGINIVVNQGLIKAFYETKGAIFTLVAIGYYIIVYPLAIWVGTLTGMIRYFLQQKTYT